MVLYLRKIGASEAEAEDASAEAMAQAYKAWDQIRSPRAWVRKAAFNSYVRHAEKARKERPVPELGMLITGCVTSIEENYQERQQEWRVIAIMRQLPPAQRKVAALFYDGLSLGEIAEATDRPVTTVRSTLRHARTRLKEVVQSEGVDSAGVT